MRRHFGAAALGCGIFFCASAADEAKVLPEARAMSNTTMQRLLLVDAKRIGDRIVAVGDRGYIVISDDRGKTWRRAKAPATPLVTAVDFLGDKLGIAVGHDSVILASADGGETWQQTFAAPAEGRPLLDVAFVKADFAVAVGAYGAYYESNDSGKTWVARKITGDDKHFNAVLELGGGSMLILGEAGAILSSTDWGKTWNPVTSPYKGSLFGGIAAQDGSIVAFGMRGRIYRSKDKGLTWAPVDNASAATLMGGERLADGTIVLAGAAGTALVSRDDGQTFVPVQTGTTRALSKPVQGEPGVVLLLGEGGPREARVPAKPAAK